MLRNIAAVLLGMLVGGVLNGALIAVCSAIFYPMPEGFDYQDAAQMAAYVKNLPLGAFVIAIVAHCVQAAVGGGLAARLGASRPLVLAGAIGAITLAGSVYNLATLPGPAWMWVEVPLILMLSWKVGQMEVHRRAARGPAADEAEANE
jgi:hypothetical protein